MYSMSYTIHTFFLMKTMNELEMFKEFQLFIIIINLLVNIKLMVNHSRSLEDLLPLLVSIRCPLPNKIMLFE